MFEMGATRMGIFGGEGRPSPDLAQLLIPTDPHVVDDPDQELPDQDEIAALDGRLTLPLAPGSAVNRPWTIWSCTSSTAART
jgi:hypothetical protein